MGHTFRRLATLAVAGLALGLAPAPASAIAGVTGEFTHDGVNIRADARTNAEIRGVGYRHHSVTVHCQRLGAHVGASPNQVWYFISDHTIGVIGNVWSGYMTTGWGVTAC